MTLFCRQHKKSTSNERAFCQALLNNEYPILDYDMCKTRKRCYRLPPENYVYGIKHPQQNGITGVAAALQHCYTPMKKISKSISVPNFITINKNAVRLGLTRVQDIHQYRFNMSENISQDDVYLPNGSPAEKTMKNRQMHVNTCDCKCSEKNSISEMTHGRTTAGRQSIRDLIENKYLHEWLQKAAVRHCKEILSNGTHEMTKLSSLK
ncbi:unnamed protein product [Rotaria magnacalcarata]|uniref:Uncharacterized protein n=2 Tax=Rotaria magnacalcarata TaxID=392030 RepID=A0A814T6B2_9BILA|nr:unnamed protein product [Rotaria magnacalcarata]CAF1458986.1 unnamed protein product [Rotaria magnacalcarata]